MYLGWCFMRHVIPVVSRWIQALSWVNLCHPFSDFRSLFILSYEWKEVVLSGDPSEESKNGTDDPEARWKKMAKWPEVLMSALNIYQQLNRQLFVSVSMWKARRSEGSTGFYCLLVFKCDLNVHDSGTECFAATFETVETPLTQFIYGFKHA